MTHDEFEVPALKIPLLTRAPWYWPSVTTEAESSLKTAAAFELVMLIPVLLTLVVMVVPLPWKFAEAPEFVIFPFWPLMLKVDEWSLKIPELVTPAAGVPFPEIVYVEPYE